MKRQKAKCFVYCRPCEHFGLCPHSYKEYDDMIKRKEAAKKGMGKKKTEGARRL